MLVFTGPTLAGLGHADHNELDITFIKNNQKLPNKELQNQLRQQDFWQQFVNTKDTGMLSLTNIPDCHEGLLENPLSHHLAQIFKKPLIISFQDS